MLISLILTFSLVLLNGVFVAAEFAIVRVRSSQIDLKIKNGHPAGLLGRKIINHLDGYLAATQLGITIASLALGYIGEQMIFNVFEGLFAFFHLSLSVNVLHAISYSLAFVLITVLHIIFGELVPKSIAIQNPTETTINLAYPLHFFYLIFRPLIWFLNGFAGIILKILGMQAVSASDLHSAEELQLILEQGKESGALDSTEHEMIQNVFDFKDRVVKNIMVPRTQIAALEINTPGSELVNMVITEGYSRLPVYTDTVDNIIGVVHAKDILPLLNSHKPVILKDIIREAYFIPESKRINDLLTELQLKRIQIAIVLDEFGGTAGMVTLEDIVEELVGEIQDEYDEEVPIVEKITENEFIVNCMASIADVNEHLPIELPEDETYDSVAGYINLIFGKIPEIGESAKADGYQFTILKKTDRMVVSSKLEVLTPPVPESINAE
jgi:CBS domain containing-hemolysin-like protein